MRKKTSAKKNAQKWYQIHKAKAGNASVQSSKRVAIARENVRLLEERLSSLNLTDNNSIFSGVRKLLFGRNAIEEKAHQIQEELKSAKLALHVEIRETRADGECEYRLDWALRNPDKVKD